MIRTPLSAAGGVAVAQRRDRQVTRTALVLLIALAVLFGLRAAGVAEAAGLNFVVNDQTDRLDANVGDGLCRTSDGTCTLRAAVQETNTQPGADVVQLPAGTYELGIPPLNQNDVTTGDLDITDSLTISGAGAAATFVDGGTPQAGAPLSVRGLDRLFEVVADGAVVTFSGLTFRDGYAAEYGGAVLNNSTAAVTVADSAMTTNVAGKTGGAIDNRLAGSVEVHNATLTNNYATESGSALNNNRDGALTVTDTAISSNSPESVGLDPALAGAGAISNNAELDARGTITVTGGEISNNHATGARSGAAISNDGAGIVTVVGTVFTRNRAEVDGGAIFNGAGEVTVTGATFNENIADNGGAIYNAVKDGRLTVSDSTFFLNTAFGGRGGAIASSGLGVLEVTGSTFTKNSADDWGGAVFNDDKGTATIRNSTFSENEGLNGGGLANEGTALTVDSSTFSKNKAFVTAVLASGEGGGLHSNSVGEVVITGGEFVENTARGGGGLTNEGGGNLAISGTRFESNHADESGGGILIQSGDVSLSDIDVVDNTSDAPIEGGGGISYHGDKLLSIGEAAAIENSRIHDNSAKGEGGGIDSRGDGPLTITTTSITGNTGLAGGGIHHVGDAPLEIRRSTLSGNFAELGGGVFTDGDGETGVENTTVSGNRAGKFGGGLLVSSRLDIRFSTVAGNSAPSGGGIDNGGGDAVGDGSVFLANTIVANNPTGGNCAGTMTSLGGNLDSANTCQLRELSDQPGTDPRLGPLADNGGPTQTHALLAESPAQESAVCTELDPCPAVDQRGVERPRFARFDVGAYESELTPEGGGEQQCAGRTERPVLADFDTWVSQSAPLANFGSDSILKVNSQPGANQRALVHFTLPSVPPGCELVGAQLRLYASAATGGRMLEARRIATPWDELGVTWNSRPATAGPAATAESGPDFREWDVLAQTLDMYGLGAHGFLIRDSVEDESASQSFHATEKGADRPPELVLIFDDPNAPPLPAVCPTGPQTLAADRDSWVSESSPTNNFGADSTLKVKSQVGNDARTLVRFPLPPLPAGCTSVASALLRLEASSAKEGRTLEALQIAAPWSEESVTWTSQPTARGSAVAIPSFDGTLEWAVTAQLLEMYVSDNHGFLIRDAEEDGVGDEQTLNGRVKLNDGPPELVLVFDDSTPETTIDLGPGSPTEETGASFTFSSDRDDATFECSLDGAAFAACTSPYAVAGLAEGSHSFAVRATRRVRAVDPTPASHGWTIAIPPETSVAGPASPSDSASASLTFSADDPDATFECSLNGADFDPCTSPLLLEDLPDGLEELRVRGVDMFGNADPTPAAHAWLVAVPPETTIVSGPTDPSNSTEAGFTFSGSDNGTAPSALAFECSLDGGDWTACSDGQAYADLADGAHTFAVRASDAAGNTDPTPASFGWTIDTVAPETTLDAQPPDPSNDSSAAFDFHADDAVAFECKLDEGEWAACSSGQSYADLADGEHTFAVRAADLAGNVDGTPASYSWTIDTVAPEAAIDSGPDGLTNDAMPTFSFSSELGASLECRVDAAEFGPCASPYTTPPLGDGGHTFEVRATDAAGNTGAAASRAVTVDTIAPQALIESGPPEFSNSTAASFVFTADETAGFECRLDGGDWATCTSPQEYGPLGDGGHSFEVRATDQAGNLGATLSYAWTVDTVAPVTTIVSGPPAPSSSSGASFVFDADETAGFECRLDAGEWATCASPQDYVELADGGHSFDVRATDQAGNLGAAVSYAWTIDTVAPASTILEGPAELSPSDEASLVFTADETAGFECRLDEGDWATCTSPQGYIDLGDGKHSFDVRATDAAGNLGAPASYTWTIDTVAPVAAIDEAPADPSNDANPSFAFSASEDASFECRLDDGDWATCTSPQAYGPLADGAHSFAVRATDLAGNLGAAASYAWTIDTVAPVTGIVDGPPALSKSSAASFAFGADEAAGFECRLDTGDWATCTSPQDYADLVDGLHSFAVRATDAAGNPGEAAAHAWTIDTVAPVTTIGEAPADPSNDANPSFAFGASEAATFECRLDEGDWVTCTSPEEYGQLADGAHSFAVRATDEAGNLGAAASYAWTIDRVAPVTTIDDAPVNPSNDASPSFAFSADETASFECMLDAGDWAVCTSPVTYADLADGVHSFVVRATDPAGNLGAAASYAWVLDTVAPVTTIERGPTALTKETDASFEFVADEAASFECRLDTGEWATCTSPRAYGPLADDAHSFAVRATDEAGNLGAAAAYAWTVDTVAPVAAIDAGPTGLTNDATPAFAFSSEPGASFECRVDAAALAACSSPHTTAVLADGAHTFEVRATDEAGNAGVAASRSFTVDTVAPNTLIDSGPSGPTNDATPSFTFSSELGAAFECHVDAAAYAPCTSPHTSAALADGAHTFEVRATDAAGNTDASPATAAFALDTVAPVTTIDAGPTGLTNDPTPTFVFSSEAGVSFQCRLDAAAFAACASPHTTAVIADGAHTFEVRATDEAGNAGAAASRSFTVDTEGLVATIDAGPSGLTSDSTPTFFFSSEPGASFQCRVDAAAFAACASPHTTSALADGAHTFEVRAIDGAGNPGAPAGRSFTVDTVAPTTSITAGPTGATTDSMPTFAFSSEADASFQCRVDAAPFAACTSPHTTSALADGAHTFEVRASDGAGNIGSAASRSFTVDTVAPATTITAGPSGLTGDSTPTFAFSSEAGASFQCRVDAAAFASCTSPHTTSAVTDGAHTFDVRASDAAGNTGAAASRTFTVDTVAPETTITGGPPATTQSTSASFAFSAGETSTFECSLDNAAFVDCTSPRDYTGLAVGDHSFRVRATDAAGNVDLSPASRSWTVQQPSDTTPPQTTIGSGAPPATTTSTSATFNFSSSEANSTIECALDGVAFASCTSPQSYTGLAVGAHAFQVRATDAAGNTDPTPAVHSWTIDPPPDTTAPDTTINGNPANPSNSTSATFTFTGSDNATPQSLLAFQCRVDAQAFATCSSPRVLSGLTQGSRTFQVRAIDLAGNLDPTPATYTWNVDVTAPETTISDGPPATTASTNATFTFASEAGATFQCSLDGAAFVTCTSPQAYTGLANGSHQFSVRAIDAAGNVDASPAAYTWTIAPAGSCIASTVTVGANADSWLLESSATSNYGNDSVLKVDSKVGANAQLVVRFALPTAPAGCNVVNARLRLYASSFKTGRTLQALGLGGAWTEGGITWANQPAAVGTPATAAAAGGYIEWGVLSQVQSMYTEGNNGFLVRDAVAGGTGIEQNFHSREKGTDNPPQLVVTFG